MLTVFEKIRLGGSPEVELDARSGIKSVFAVIRSEIGFQLKPLPEVTNSVLLFSVSP